MRCYGVYLVRYGSLFNLVRLVSLFQCALYEGEFSIGYRAVERFVTQVFNLSLRVLADAHQLLAVWHFGNNRLYVLVALEKLDGEESGRVARADVLVLAYLVLGVRDNLLKVGSVVYVNVAVRMFCILVAEAVLARKVSKMLGMFGCKHVFLVPFLNVFQDILVYRAVSFYEVAALVDVDDDVEQLFNSASVSAHRRNHRHSEQFCKRVIVEFVSAFLQFVVHVQGAYHS